MPHPEQELLKARLTLQIYRIIKARRVTQTQAGEILGTLLHPRPVPRFLGPDQVFVPGPELKADLHRLDEHYMQLPEEERARGMWRFAPAPPSQWRLSRQPIVGPLFAKLA
jgi:hypothetical protein